MQPVQQTFCVSFRLCEIHTYLGQSHINSLFQTRNIICLWKWKFIKSTPFIYGVKTGLGTPVVRPSALPLKLQEKKAWLQVDENLVRMLFPNGCLCRYSFGDGEGLQFYFETQVAGSSSIQDACFSLDVAVIACAEI